MKKILIATDGSDESRQAVDFGLELAEEQAAEEDQILGPLLGPQRADEVHREQPRRNAQALRARLGLFDDVRNTVSRHLERGGYVRGLANRRNS